MKNGIFAALAALAFIGVQVEAPARAAGEEIDTDGPSFAMRANHVGISVPDLDESIAWYQRMLGFELVRKMTSEDPKMVFALLHRDDINVELFQLEEGRAMPDYRFDPTADLYVHGVKHLAFEVEDAVAASSELEAKGARILLGPVVTPRTTYVFLADNSGNPFELIQFKEE
jgi:methylmalonyl-CoA/ethylmalonyl-CoA epimerase